MIMINKEYDGLYSDSNLQTKLHEYHTLVVRYLANMSNLEVAHLVLCQQETQRILKAEVPK